MTYIIHGATGAQGAPVLAALTAGGHSTTAAVRHIEALPDGVTGVAVDLANAAALTRVYTGAEGVFIHLPMGAPEQVAAQADAIATAVIAAQPQRVVISTSGAVLDDPQSPLLAPADSPIATLVRRVVDSGVSTAIVTPRLYLENLLLPVIAGPATADGVLNYPLPADYPVSWSSHLDVAEVVVRLLTESTHTGFVGVGHLPGLTGPDLAAAFAAGLGIDVSYTGITPAEFGTLIAPLFGPAAAPVVALYTALNTQTEFVVPEATSAQALLGLSPRPLAQWLAEVAGIGGSAAA